MVACPHSAHGQPHRARDNQVQHGGGHAVVDARIECDVDPGLKERVSCQDVLMEEYEGALSQLGLPGDVRHFVTKAAEEHHELVFCGGRARIRSAGELERRVHDCLHGKRLADG